ncbi:MAG TPA: YqcC family protein [Bryobacteraceae bacterium]|nr:YqcC family protein [Bryobacteraceae bacterium]
MDCYQAAAVYADRIERQLRARNAWQAEPPPAGAFESQTAFFADTMTFYQWLQFVLVPRVREIVERRGQFPAKSSVGAYAVRELDGTDADGELIEALCAFDDFIERNGES